MPVLAAYDKFNPMIRNRLQAVLGRIEAACTRSGRSAKEIELVLVSKQVDAGLIQEAYQTGIRDFGENRVQEWLAKRETLPRDIRWHMIGHLQTNKAKHVVGGVALIHSCDRLDLALELQKQAEKKGLTVQALVQVNTSGEETKYGLSPAEVKKTVSEMCRFDRVKLGGLMTIGPFTSEESEIRKSFRTLREIRAELQNDFPSVDWHYLSMGMTNDFELAIEEGANCLRLGTAVFGARSKVEN